MQLPSKLTIVHIVPETGFPLETSKKKENT